MKTSFMQNNHYTALEPCQHWAYIALLILRVHLSLSLLVINCFRGGRHRADRWVLRGHRRVVCGSQVAAWDVVEQASWDVYL